MTKFFTHTHRERDLWRGWLKNGQSFELSRSRHGWSFGGGIHIHSNNSVQGDRMLFVRFWRFTAVVPLGIIPAEYQVGDEPQWSIYGSDEFGLSLHCGKWRKSWDWPWSFDWHRTSYLLADGSWLHDRRGDPHADGLSRYSAVRKKREGREWTAEHPYTYRLKSGDVQNVVATIKVSEVERRRKFLRWTRIGARVGRAIDVEFSGEVGEKAGSWKGGTIGCGYTMLPGETPEQCLRRMERDRKFR